MISWFPPNPRISNFHAQNEPLIPALTGTFRSSWLPSWVLDEDHSTSHPIIPKCRTYGHHQSCSCQDGWSESPNPHPQFSAKHSARLNALIYFSITNNCIDTTDIYHGLDAYYAQVTDGYFA